MLETNKKAQEYVNILDLPIYSKPKDRLLTAIKQKLTYNAKNRKLASKISIYSANPELLLMAKENKNLFKALRSTTYLIPDGVGINYASLWLHGIGLEVIPGRELFMDLIAMANTLKLKVFLLGGLDNEAELCLKKLKSQYKDLVIMSHPGFKLDITANVIEVDKKSYIDTVKNINDFKPDMLFVAFGNPKQEIWLNNHLDNLNIALAMTVGGTFRYIAGLSKLPPQWISGIGLEWLWRLLWEPQRFRRIFNAVVVFPIKILISK